MLYKIAPILTAINISATNLFYRNHLLFETRNFGNYLLVSKDEIEIHYRALKETEKFMPASCYIYCDNIKDLYARFSSMDLLNVESTMMDNAWGKKEFHLLDNNGNMIKFGSR